MTWKRISEIDASPTVDEVDEIMPSVEKPKAEEHVKTDKGERLPKVLFDALNNHRRTLQARRNALIAQRIYERFASKLGPEHIDDFLEGQRKLEEAQAEWERKFDSPEGRRISSDDHIAEWNRTVRW